MSSRDKWRIARRNVIAGKSSGAKILIGFSLCFFLMICMAVMGSFYKDYKRDFGEKYRQACYFYKSLKAVTLSELEEEKTQFSGIQEQIRADICSRMVTLRSSDDAGIMMRDAVMQIDGETYRAKHYSTDASRAFYENITSGMAQLDIALFETAEDWCGNIGGELLIGRWPDKEGELLADDYLLSVFGLQPSDVLGKTVSIADGEKEILKQYTFTGVVSRDLLRNREGVWNTLEDYHLEHIFVFLKQQDRENFTVTGTVRFYYRDVEQYTESYDFVRGDSGGIEMPEAVKNAGLSLTDKGIMICMLTFFVNRFGVIIIGIGVGLCILIMASLFYVVWFYLQRNKRYMMMLECIGMERKDRKGLRNRELAIMGTGAWLVAIYLGALFFIVFRYLAEKALGFEYKFHFGLFFAVVIVGTAVFRILTDVVVRKYDVSVTDR